MSPPKQQPDAPDWFRKLLTRGPLVHGPKGKKKLTKKAWNEPRNFITTADGYVPDRNWFVINGSEIAPGRFQVDADFDWQPGVPYAEGFLGPTDCGFGRGSIAITHGFYTVSEPFSTIYFRDIDDRTVFFELRCRKQNGSYGFYTMMPPSVHDEGMVLEWRTEGEPAHSDNLKHGAALYATFCILAFHLRERERAFLHALRLPLAGFLLQEGVSEAETLAISTALARFTRNDVKDAETAVYSTVAKIRQGERVTGKGELAKGLGTDGKRILARIREWLGGKQWALDTKDNILPNNESNVRLALEKLDAKLSYDEFGDRVLLEYGGIRQAISDFTKNRVWLDIEKYFHFRPSVDFFDIVLYDVAFENKFHPVRDYLNSLKWDGKPRLDEWLITYAAAKDKPFTRAVSRLPFFAAVARVRDTSGDGVKFDELLVLESDQGLLKSTALRTLCPREEWFMDNFPLNLDAKQLIERTLGKWIIEASELAGLRQSDIELLKGSLSRQKDGPVRLAYARTPTERARQFIVIGTTNSQKYLKDSTGNRRFWPLKVGKFDVAGLREVREQLWAEAAERVELGESIRLDPSLYPTATKQQEQRRQEDPWEDILTEVFDLDECNCVVVDSIWQVLGGHASQRDIRHSSRVANILQRYGFVLKQKRRIQSKPKWVWLKPDAVQLPHDSPLLKIAEFDPAEENEGEM